MAIKIGGKPRDSRLATMSGRRQEKRPRRILSRVFLAIGGACIFLYWLWAIGAIWYHEWLTEALALVIIVGLIFAAAALLVFQDNSLKSWFSWLAGIATGIWLLTLLQFPSHDRDWAQGQQELAHIEINDQKVLIQNFRDNVYRSENDFDVRFRDFAFDLSELKQVWFVVQHFTQAEGLAHVFLTFQVGDNAKDARYFAVSVETRRERDEPYTPVQGLYRQYELSYLFGSEEDFLGVRTIHRRKDRVFMYPVNANQKQVQDLFRSIAKRTNQIEQQPEFYHSVFNNCMQGILEHTYNLTPEPISWMNPKIMLPGYSDRFAFEHGLIGDGKDFEALTQQCRIDEIARKHGATKGFSKAIRGQ